MGGRRRRAPAWPTWLLVGLCVWLGAGSPPEASASPDANRLLEDLMSTYNKLVRPVQSNSERVVVWLSLELSQLIDVNLKEQIMETNIWLEQEWYDHKLKWDPSEYGGIEDMSVPAEQIWLPDIVLYNSAEGYFAVSIMTRAQVHFDGRVNWNPPAIFRSSCHIDITYFPFDTQNCKLKFGSWTFGPLLDLRHRNETEGPIERGIELKHYHQNVEWDIMEASARRNVEIYSCCPNDPYLDVTFYLVLRRKPLFYTINLIVPCIVITALSLLVFFLPSDSGEKVTLTISILVSLIFFLSVLIETIPSTSLAMPLLGKYLVFTMILITLSVCATVCVLNIHFRTPSTHDMSPWIKRWFIHLLPKYLLLNTTHSQQASLLPEHLIYPPNQVYIAAAAAAAEQQSAGPPKLAVNQHGSQLVKQLHQLDANNLLANQLLQDQVSPNISHDGSGLFLPYLQSEAARRLQMQRSRSSDRDQKSTSELVQANLCDNNKPPNNAANRRKEEAEPSNKRKRQPLGSLLLGGSQRAAAAAASRRRRSKSKSNADTCEQATSNNHLQQQSSSTSQDHDYRHHTHFLARASVCQTNLWRVGPTRRCSQLAPLDYPTYYRPHNPAWAPQAAGGGPLQQLHQQPPPMVHHNLHQCQHHSARPPGATAAAAAVAAALVTGSAACQMSPAPRLAAGAGGASLATLRGPARPKSGAPPPPPPPAREHLARGQAANSALECAANLNPWIRARDDPRAPVGYHQSQQQQQQQAHRQQMLLLSQVPRANHANPPINSAAATAAPNSSIHRRHQHQSRQCSVSAITGATAAAAAAAALDGRKQWAELEGEPVGGPQRRLEQPGPVLGGPHQPVSGSGGRADSKDALYTTLARPSDGHRAAQANPSSGAHLSGSVFGGPGLLDSKSPAPVSDRAWQEAGAGVELEFPPPPSFDCDLLLAEPSQHLGPAPPTKQMTRSRSTDHRLHSAAGGYYKPPGEPDQSRWPADWHSHRSAGRALGQAYLQRLQPDCSAHSSNEQPPTAARMSRSSMHEAQLRHQQQHQQQHHHHSLAWRHSRAPDCPLDAQGRAGQSCSMPRSKSQSSLERLVRSAAAAAAAAQSNPQVQACRQARLGPQQPCAGCHQQRNRSSTLQGPSARNLALLASGVHNQGSRCSGGGGACGACGSCAGSSLNPSGLGAPRAVLAGQPQSAANPGQLARFSQELDKAIENAMFIAQHIDNLDEFESVKENWKYIAMVIDRIFLIVFLVAGFIGSVAIFAMAPWSYYTKYSPIDLHLAHLNALNLTGADLYYKSCP